MQTIVEMNHVEMIVLQYGRHFIEQGRVAHTLRTGKPPYVGFAFQQLFDFGVIPSRDGIAEQQDVRLVRLVGPRQPDIGPFDVFAGNMFLCPGGSTETYKTE